MGKCGLERLPSIGASGTRQRDQPHWVLVTMMSGSRFRPMVGPSSWWGRRAVGSVSVYQAESECPRPEWKTSGPRAGWQSPKAGGVVCDVLCGRQDCVLSDGTPQGGGHTLLVPSFTTSSRTCLSLAGDNLRLWQDQPREGWHGGTDWTVASVRPFRNAPQWSRRVLGKGERPGLPRMKGDKVQRWCWGVDPRDRGLRPGVPPT